MTVVLDASVALKWQFNDEEATAEATALLQDFVDGKIELITPTFFTYEILSGINVAINRKRIKETDSSFSRSRNRESVRSCATEEAKQLLRP